MATFQPFDVIRRSLGYLFFDGMTFTLTLTGTNFVAASVVQFNGTARPVHRAVVAVMVGLSGFLTLAFEQMKATVEAIKEAGLRDQVKIMIGGAIMDREAAQYVGADAYGANASAAVKIAKSWMGGM